VQAPGVRTARSRPYVEALSRLDTGTPGADLEKAVADLVEQIRGELGEIELNLPKQLVGIVARCYLGDPYEVHTLDLTHRIVHHYRSSEPLPGLLEQARGLALHPAYAFVEVYENLLVAIRRGGEVAVVEIGDHEA